MVKLYNTRTRKMLSRERGEENYYVCSLVLMVDLTQLSKFGEELSALCWPMDVSVRVYLDYIS